MVESMEFLDMLIKLAYENGSDLYLSTGAVPSIKFNGVLTPIQELAMKPGETTAIANDIMDSEQQATFEKELEMNLALSLPKVGRFRVNIFRQRNEISIVARNIKLDIPTFEELKLPPVLLDVIMEKRGLVLFVGATGSGKSTSLAALIDHRNKNTSGHIITIEDPIEYVHPHKKSIINFFPEERRDQLMNDLGNNLKAFVSQRLVKTVDGKRRAAVEILLGTATIQDMIRRGDFSNIKEIMEKSVSLGMKTFDQCLFELYCEGVISEDEALRNADSVNNLKLRIKLHDEKGGLEVKGQTLNWELDPLKKDETDFF